MFIVDFIPIIWFLLAGIIPIALLIIGIIKLINKVEIGETLIKLFVAFLLHLPVTIFCGVYVASMSNAIEHTKGTTVNGVRLVPTVDLTFCAVVFGYGIFGFFLCWFVNKNLSKILSIVTRSKQSTQSIFDEK
jgi:hypothetical protein